MSRVLNLLKSSTTMGACLNLGLLRVCKELLEMCAGAGKHRRLLSVKLNLRINPNKMVLTCCRKVLEGKAQLEQ